MILFQTFVLPSSALAVNFTSDIYERFKSVCQDGQVKSSKQVVLQLFEDAIKETLLNMREPFGRYKMQKKKLEEKSKTNETA